MFIDPQNLGIESKFIPLSCMVYILWVGKLQQLMEVLWMEMHTQTGWECMVTRSIDLKVTTVWSLSAHLWRLRIL